MYHACEKESSDGYSNPLCAPFSVPPVSLWFFSLFTTETQRTQRIYTERVGLSAPSVAPLCALCVSVIFSLFTTETQRTQRFYTESRVFGSLYASLSVVFLLDFLTFIQGENITFASCEVHAF